jgi:hypothetical protein
LDARSKWITREGRASFSWSKNSNSTFEALREKRLKFTPPGTIVAPIGELWPVFSAGSPAADLAGAKGT